MFTNNILYYGKAEPLPRQIPLRAGPLTMLYEDGDLRHIKLGERELIRRIYVAIRDRNWGTILPVFSNVQLNIGPDRFHISYEVENKLNDIHFTWLGAITGEPAEDGALAAISFNMEGQAITSFLKNRIGFCVLHPAGVAGLPCSIEHIDGSYEAAAFPTTIDPDQPPLPFTDIQAMTHEVVPGVQAEVRFFGDAFEMEDQRNWTDASFKTFCTPLRFPYPVEIHAGTQVYQAVRLALKGKLPPGQGSTTEPGLTLKVDPSSPARLPEIGIGAASHGGALSSLEITRLKALHLAHLRVDLHLNDPSYPDVLRQRAGESASLGLPLHLAVHIPKNGANELAKLRKLVDELHPNVALWLVYPTREIFTGGSLTHQAVALARQYLPGPFAAGADTDFIFMQRTLPPFDQLEAACFAINPQVHAFDNLSLVESLEGQVSAVESARRLAGGRPIIVSPVTLKPRHNPYATGGIPPTPAGQLPAQVDPRQLSLFAAGWTLGSIRSMAISGATAVTYYETTGWRGVMETQAGSPVPDKFHSSPGMVYPLYHVLADIAEFTGAEVLAVTTNDELKAQGLALRKKDRTCLLVANFTPNPQTVNIANLAGLRTVRFLDENTVRKAMSDPETYRAQNTQLFQGEPLTLLPFAVARLDT